METIQIVLLAIILCIASAGSLAAQGDEGSRPEGHRPPPPLLVALDVNRDGAISTNELAAAPESIAGLDRNGDGEITLQELHPRPPHAEGNRDGPRPGAGQERQEGSRPHDGPRPPHHLGPLMNVLDADGDGRLSAAEIENSWKSLLNLDADADGTLSRDELRPPRPEGAGDGQHRSASRRKP